MDFIEGIGEQYIRRKATNVPQQLEDLAKRQFSSATDTKKQAEHATTLPAEEKDQEIAKLREQLAETKLDKGKAIGAVKAAKSEKGIASSELLGVKSGKSKTATTSATETKHSGGSAKEKARLKKGLVPLSIDADTASTAAKDTKGSEAGRGRRSSAGTATAAIDYHTSSAKGGGYSSNPNPGNEKGEIRGLEALGAIEALPHKARSRRAASTAQASEFGGAAKSAGSTLRASSGRRPSTSRASDIGSEARSTGAVVAPRPPPPPSMHHAPRRREPVHVEEIRRYEVEEPGMCIVEVEEEPPRRRKSTTTRREGGGEGGVVEVLSSKGRTVYRVS